MGVDLWAVWGVVEFVLPEFGLKINGIISIEKSDE